MKKIVCAILTVLACSWIPGVSADKGSGKQSPESIVSCVGEFTFVVLYRSIPEPINGEQCRTYDIIQPPDPCAPCITSLENQGCKVIDVVVTNIKADDNFDVGATYMMSCVKP